MSNNFIDVSIVSPVFNEEEVIRDFYNKVSEVLDAAKVNYEIVFVDDGSRDRSFELLKAIHNAAPQRITVVKFARNFGHQIAITAGIREAKGKSVVVMDCDLQDPPEVILGFIEKWNEGHDVVYGVRTQRKGETFFKKFTAKLFYKFMGAASNTDVLENVGDFYLLDRKVVDVLNQMDERHRFIRGMVAWVGFKRTAVEYVRQARKAGKTKYSLWKMVKFSFDAATSFSFVPLRVISVVGFVISTCAFLGILVAIYWKVTSAPNWGWASLMAVILFIGGVQMLAIGVIGEYLARIGDDVRHRPLFTVKEILD